MPPQMAADTSKDDRDRLVAAAELGAVLVAQGDTAGALIAFRKGLAIAEALAARDPTSAERQRDLSVSHNKIGEVLVAQGDTPSALATFRKALAIREALAPRDPANTGWQRDLAVSHNKIGEVLVARGDMPGALTAFRKTLAIIEALAARDPANTEWQRDLSVSHSKIGDVLVAQGDTPGALSRFGRTLRSPKRWPRATRRTPRGSRPLGEPHQDWRGAGGAGRYAERADCIPQRPRDRRSAGHARPGQHRLAVGPRSEPCKIGDEPVYSVHDRRADRVSQGAHESEALAARDPTNTAWQRDLSVSHNKVGDVDGAGRRAGRADRVSEALANPGAMAARDPTNTEWQRDLSVSHNRVGEGLQAQGDVAGALATFRRARDRRSVGRARPGEHRVAAGPRSEPPQDWRCASGAGRHGGGADRVSEGAHNYRSAGRARPGEH